MKRLISIILSIVMILTGCSSPNNVDEPSNFQNTESGSSSTEWIDVNPDFSSLNDESLLLYMEDLIYKEAVQSLNSENYLVENVRTVFVSKEYLEEVAFNSQSNIYFGFTLAELDEAFDGDRYVFTLGEDGNTAVKRMEQIDDSITNDILKNVVVGSGVVLVCVTVSAVTAGTGAPAISMIFAASAKTGSIMALSSGGFGAISAGIVRGIETGDFEEAVKAAALAGSEGFKWGAISGAIAGGASETIKYTKAMQALKGAQLNGLTTQQAAAIQMESGYPVDVIKQFKNMDQYNICKNAGLSPKIVNGQTALVRNIDLNYVDELGRTNLERMSQGLAALDDTGTAYQLHHIGQKADSTLAILTKAEHMQGGNNAIWHELGTVSEVHGVGNTWDAQRQAFWKSIAKSMGGI